MEKFLIKQPSKKSQQSESVVELTKIDSSLNTEKESEVASNEVEVPNESSNAQCQSLEIFESDDDDERENTEPQKKKVKYSRKFSDFWLKSDKLNKWLEKKDNYAYCKLCKIKLTSSLFHIKRHGETKLHLELEQELQQTKSIKSFYGIGEGNKFIKLEEKVYGSELKLVMFLAEHNLPFMLLEHLPKFLQSCAPDSEIVKKIKCSRTKGTELMKIIARENCKSISDDLKTSFFSLIIDESTDIGSVKCLAIIMRYFKGENVKDRFLELITCTDGSADGIFRDIQSCFASHNIEYKQMIGFGSDNCATMMGKNHSVKTNLEEVQNHIFIFGCVCHQMHLCAMYASKYLPSYIDLLTKDIYAHFSWSTKRRLAFKEYQEFLSVDFHNILKAGATRWLSLEAAINRIIEQWEALQLYFTTCAMESKTDAECIRTDSIVSALRDPVIKCYFLFLSYILKIVNGFNVEFQSQRTLIHLVIPRVSSLFKTVARGFMESSAVVNSEILEIDFTDKNNYLPTSQVYLGPKAELKVSKHEKPEEFHKMREKVREFYIELLIQFKKRFGFEREDLKIIQYFSPQIVVSGKVSSILSVLKILPQFEPFAELFNTEWRLLAEVDEVKKFSQCDIEDFWYNVGEIKNAIGVFMFANISAVAKAICALPHSSATVERTFSQNNLIKNKHRNGLLPQTCSTILSAKDLLKTDSSSCHTWEPSKKLLQMRFENVNVGVGD